MKDDIAYLSNQLGYDIPFYTNIFKENLNIEKVCVENLRGGSESINKYVYSSFTTVSLIV